MSSLMSGADIGLAQQPFPVSDAATQAALEELYRAVHALNSVIFDGNMLHLPQYTTATRPTAVAGAMIFDTTLGKACIGTSAGVWQVITSV